MAEFSFAGPRGRELQAARTTAGPSSRGTAADYERSQQVIADTKDNFQRAFGAPLTTNSEARSRDKQAELYQRWQNGESGIYIPVNPDRYPNADYFHLYSMDISPGRLGAAERKWLQDNGWQLIDGARDPVHWQYVGNTTDKTYPPVTSTTDRQQGASQIESRQTNLPSSTLSEQEKNNLYGNTSEMIVDEFGRPSNLRRNTETGELYDPGTLYTNPKAPNTDDRGTAEPAVRPSTDGSMGQRIGAANQGSSGPTGNILDRYPNYTYGISLHYMPIKKYNDVLVKGAAYKADDNTVLIASGGRTTADLARHPVFKHDMYFEDFKMYCVIGHNAKSRGSNAIDISFTVIEPLGMTLIDKILTVAQGAGINQWDQMPFIIQIDFFANEESGKLATPIPGATKRICVKIIDIQIKVQPKGATYRITAIPQSHVALLQSNASTPANFEVMAKKVKDFFASEGDVGTFGEAVNASRNAVGRDEKNQQGQKKTFKISSYAAAMNSFQEQLKKLDHQKTADVYKFEFDKEMAESDIFIPDFIPIARTAVQNDKNQNAKLDREKGMIPINAGTNIKEVINLVLRASEYYRKQILSNAANANEMESQNSQYVAGLIGNEPIQSHKITTTVEYGAWDDIRKVYQKTITFKIEKYSYFNTKYPEAKRGIPTNWDKEYNYVYTGQNQQILDFDIDFNTMFFTVLTAMEKKYQAERVQVTKEDQDKPDTNNKTGQALVQVSRPLPVINLAQDKTEITSTNQKNVEATDLFKSMMSNSRGDMINVQLKIAGDPQLIKQDDVFSNLNGSLATDKRELFVKLEFRLPEDIDQTTGLYKINERSVFSGIYKIISVNNLFERGQFTQTLDLIRLFDQPYDKLSDQSTKQSSPRATSEPSTTDSVPRTVSNPTPVSLPSPSSAPVEYAWDVINRPQVRTRNFQDTTGAGEFGENDPIPTNTRLQQALNQNAAPANLIDFGT